MAKLFIVFTILLLLGVASADSGQTYTLSAADLNNSALMT